MTGQRRVTSSAANYSISNTAEYGEYVSGPRILPYDETKARMKAVLSDIQTGKFVRDFMQENAVGQPFFKATRRINDEHQIEKVGERLRSTMSWIKQKKLKKGAAQASFVSSSK